jgi:hypothetical protein
MDRGIDEWKSSSIISLIVRVKSVKCHSSYDMTYKPTTANSLHVDKQTIKMFTE